MPLQRIVSLTPSLTETVFALGAGERLAGVTDACDYPAEANSKPHVCSWVDPDLERIAALRPDLVLGLTSAHGRLSADFEAMGMNLVLFDPATIDEVLHDMERLANLLDVPEAGRALTDGLRQQLAELDEKVGRLATRLTVARVLDVEGEKLIVAGPRSFQYDVIRRAGGINVTGSEQAAYPKISFRQFRTLDPEVVFVCGTDPAYPARLAATPGWEGLRAVKNGRLYQFDCGLTCRTGPRIVDMAELLFAKLYR